MAGIKSAILSLISFMLGQLTEILDGPAFSGSNSPSVGVAVET